LSEVGKISAAFFLVILLLALSSNNLLADQSNFDSDEKPDCTEAACTPTKISQCNFISQNVVEKCSVCSQSPENLASTNVTYTNCQTGEEVSESVVCVPYHSGAMESKSKCEAGLDQWKEKKCGCCEGAKTPEYQQPNCPGMNSGEVASNATAYPACDTVKELAEIACFELSLSKSYTGTVDEILDDEPSDASISPSYHDNAPETGEVVGDFDLPPESIEGETLNQDVEFIRFELPANTLKHFIVQKGLRHAMEKIKENLKKYALENNMQLKSKCDPEKLTCSIDPIELLKPEDINSNSFKVKKVGNGIELDELKITKDHVTIKYNGKIEISAERPLSINLADHSSLRPLPFQVDSSTSKDIDRFMFYRGTTTNLFCDADGSGEYVATRMVYKCKCMASKSYCIADSYKGPRDPVSFEIFPNLGASSEEFACEPGMTGFRNRLVELGYEQSDIGTIVDEATKYGCSGFQLPRPDGDLPSAIAAHIGGWVSLPKIVAKHTGAGYFELELDFMAEASKWLEKRWWGWLIGWMLRLVQKFMELGIDILSSAVINLFGQVEAHVDLHPVSIVAHPVAAAKTMTNSDGQQVVKFQLGIRRIAMSPMKVDELSFNATHSWDPCNFDIHNPTSWLVSIIGCPLQALKNLLNSIFWSLVNLLNGISDFLLGIGSSIIEAEIESVLGSEFTDLDKGQEYTKRIYEAYQRVMFSSVLLNGISIDKEQIDSLTGVASDAIEAMGEGDIYSKGASIHFPLASQICSAAQMPDGTPSDSFYGSCRISQLAFGNLLFDRHHATFRLERLGAKQHYRSIPEGVPSVPDLKKSFYNIPDQAKYCHTSDVFSVGEQKVLSDFVEIDNIQTDEGKKIDFRKQCAFFADVKTKHSLLAEDEGFAILFEPTLRTNYLINEVFVCQNSQVCNPSLGELSKRAQLAVCSLAADLRVGHQPGVQQYLSYVAADALQGVESAVTLTNDFFKYLNDVKTAVGVDVNGYFDEIQESYLFQSTEQKTKALQWLGKCNEYLTESGYPPKDPVSLGVPESWQYNEPTHQAPTEKYQQEGVRVPGTVKTSRVPIKVNWFKSLWHKLFD
jgi:hypothetical protein